MTTGGHSWWALAKSNTLKQLLGSLLKRGHHGVADVVDMKLKLCRLHSLIITY